MKKVNVAFNNANRMILGAPRFCSAREMFAHTYTSSCMSAHRRMIESFRGRIERAKNGILVAILESDIRFCSPMWRNWDVSLYTRYT